MLEVLNWTMRMNIWVMLTDNWKKYNSNIEWKRGINEGMLAFM
jgi:hypothetical protein